MHQKSLRKYPHLVRPSFLLALLAIARSTNSLSQPSSPSPQLKRTIQNLLSISTHLQNPDLYSTSWANCCTVTEPSPIISRKKKRTSEDYIIRASRDIEKGELITLYPVHAIGLKSSQTNRDDKIGQMDKDAGVGVGVGMGVGSSVTKKSKKQTIRKRIKMNKERFLESYDYLYHDSKWDFDLTVPHMKLQQHEVKISLPFSPSHAIFGVHSSLLEHYDNLYVQSHPKRKLLPGWYGHLIPTKLSNVKSLDMKKTNNPNNCILVPIPCSIPLLGVVANRDIEQGEIIRRQLVDEKMCGEGGDDKIMSLVKQLIQRYTPEISELSSYYKMAYEDHEEEESPPEALSSSMFHQINQSYPKLQKLNSDPDIYIVPNFLSSQECDELIEKASPHMIPCLIKSQESGAVQNDAITRTSTNANIPRDEVPSITEKIMKLMNSSEEQLEIYQLLRYEKGQEFKPHTDGFDGPITACGFFQSGRIATIFCYLNDVENGGKTVFNQIGVEVTPKKGTAVVHFPMTMDLIEDKRTEHQGSEAIDTKWILTTWLWKDERLDHRYAESNLQVLSNDII